MTDTLTPRQLVALAMANPGKPVARGGDGPHPAYWDERYGLHAGGIGSPVVAYQGWTMLDDPTLWRPWPEFELPDAKNVTAKYRENDGDTFEHRKPFSGHEVSRLNRGDLIAWRPAQEDV